MMYVHVFKGKGFAAVSNYQLCAVAHVVESHNVSRFYPSRQRGRKPNHILTHIINRPLKHGA